MSKVYLAADHAGFALKGILLEYLSELGYEGEDLGAFEFAAEDDYPDLMTPLALRVASEERSFGIAIGGSGQGEMMCANRVGGARAALFYGPRAAVAPLEQGGGNSEDIYDIVRLPRAHNDANILSLGARFISTDEAKQAVKIFLDTPFSAGERHLRRLAKF
ncbi:MAG: RpiB/LacA/LacB family sugar-phosphate isomerase [Candidatus Paceibacterota bacterium]